LFGSIVSTTDPVAVTSMMKNLGASKRLTTTIEGESLLNDGTAMVIFLVMVEIAEGVTPEWYFIVLKFLRLAVIGPIIGFIFGFILTFWLRRINKKPILEANLTVAMAYLCFFVCEHEYV
jgi:NhaP-type Na+/H+ or K+/H+ antiporter